ncbi:MAG: YceD family protein [Rhodocyclaceae bacterium]|nr:YceD family protein [Rhodocyclaceae bacterium]
MIDSLEFAREGGRLEGDAPVGVFPRLTDVLVDDKGSTQSSLHWELAGEQGGGRYYLTLRLQGNLNLRCQRCLETVVWPVDLKSRLLLVPPGEEWPDDELMDDRSDAIEATKALALLPLVEEEVLLALPIAPRHKDCRPPTALDEHEPSPFAVLAKLRKGV